MNVFVREAGCPHCQGPVVVAETRYGRRSSCKACGIHGWDDKEMVPQELHDARQAAHRAFDALWRDEGSSPSMRPKLGEPIMRRGAAYRALQDALGMTPQDCHMANMSLEDALRVPAAVEQIRRTHHDEQRIQQANARRG